MARCKLSPVQKVRKRKYLRRRSGLQMAFHVLGLGEGRELELQNFKFSTNDK